MHIANKGRKKMKKPIELAELVLEKSCLSGSDHCYWSKVPETFLSFPNVSEAFLPEVRCWTDEHM